MEIVLFDGPLAGRVLPMPGNGPFVNDGKEVYFHDEAYCYAHYYLMREADGDVVGTFVRSQVLNAEQSVAARDVDEVAERVKYIVELVQDDAQTATLDANNVAMWARACLYAYASLSTQIINQPITSADSLVQDLSDAAQAWYRRRLERN